MDGFGGGSKVLGSSELQGVGPLAGNSTGNAVFDASQYAFFGGDTVEEVELGGLEDEEDGNTNAEYDEEEFQMDKEEGGIMESLSEIDDLSRSFSKNSLGNRSANIDGYGVWGSRESSSVAEPATDADLNSWIDQRSIDYEYTSDSRRFSAQPYGGAPQFIESNTLHRTSSYPEQQQIQNQQKLLHQRMNESALTPRSSFTSYPPPGVSTQPSPSQLPVTLPNMPPFSYSHIEQRGMPHGSPIARSLPQFPQGFPVNNHAQNQWPNQGGHHQGNSMLQTNYMQQKMSQQNGLQHSQMRPLQTQHLQLARSPQQQPSFGPGSGLHSSFGPNFSPSPNFDILGLQDARDPRTFHMPRKQFGHFPYHAADRGFLQGDSGWNRFRSKYMTADEIENILRMQLVATHSSDPYVEDYYHQACLSRKSAGAKLKHHFCPTALRDGSPKPRASDEPHAFLQVDALGKVAFSSIRRPRPLLEVDSPDSSSSLSGETKHSQKPLEQEPLLAARVTIEDGISFLLDIDDIDRFLQFNQLPDGGAQLRQRRLILLEELASSLHIADPLAKSGQQVNLSTNNDLVFLRIVSLPKGRKLLLKFLQLLLPGELTRVVCMAIFRNLRFLFGCLPTDPGASAIIASISEKVSSCTQKMDLKALASCLASVVCSAEHPPLRPIGSPSGDGASLILKSVLEQATVLLTDPHSAGNISPPIRSFWQASFDAFFVLLMKYCSNKYDSVVQTFSAHGPADSNTNVSEVAKAINKELPVELLRASLPHTSEQQRKILVEFSQRSMTVSGH